MTAAPPASPPRTSIELRRSRAAMLAAYSDAAAVGPLTWRTVESGSGSVAHVGSVVHVGGADLEGRVAVVPHPYTGSLRPEELASVTLDAFALAMVGRGHPGTDTVILLAGEPAAHSLRTWLTGLPGLGGVRVDVVDVPC